MIPQDEFENWFREAIGITIEEAKRRGVWDIDTLQSAFFAGITIGMASFAAERHAANRDLSEGATWFWQMAINEEKNLQERFNK